MASTSSPAIDSEIAEITNAFDGIASPSASSSTSAILFDVYINHHRNDDRLKLATAIYNVLDLIGLKAYLNSDELELGDFLPRAVEQAMHNACLHIAIFSHGYAQSPWCLEELSIMLKSLTPIIPVFYGVQPSDLRYVSQRKGMYAEAFLEYQQKGRYSLEKIEEWKTALHNVSFYWGEIINDSVEEQMALKNIVKHIVKIIRTVPLEMEKHSVGLQEAVVGSEMLTSSTPLQKLRIKMMPYDVCINHRGADVKDTLAIAIYNALGYMEYRVFLDTEEFQLGDFFPAAIQEALSSASVYIPIFSPRYAQSPWCLEELSFMVETEKIIIPVFYHVQPADLINIGQGKGMYAKTFLEHQERGKYSLEKLQEWMRALYKISSINGYMIDDNDKEQRVLKSIVDNVLINLRKLPLEVAMHPVGLDQAVADFEMSLRESVRSHSKVQIVGIYGKGGSGKTTLAKAIYNWKHKSVLRSSFIFNVRDAARKRLLIEKQKNLLKDLRFKSLTFDNEEEGRHILQSHLRSLSVLIVLDDVGDTDQLDTLLPEPESLGIGSLVIVTTRDSNVLKQWGISAIYLMRALNATHAKELFCWHAFKQPCPLPGFEVLVENFIFSSDRLPLPLVIAGGQLYDRYDKDYWQVLLHKFSYDALNEEEKQMFLDTACFFIGEESSLAIAVWDGSVWSGVHGWESLISKHLVYLDENNRIRMRDDLRDFGREIADQQSPYRLWSPWQFNQIQPLQKHIEIRGMINVTGDNCYSSKGKIIINQGQGFPSLTPASLGLKLFACSGEFLNQEVGELSRELLWLRWNDFNHTNLPPWLSLKNLRVLELNGALNLQELWTDDAHVSYFYCSF
ncbi:hypothetical protein SUGI_0677210 [Cryptomeria japonica]|nr:hypothetical protein SUGI_0677210 [Cryptomeria japonica]